MAKRSKAQRARASAARAARKQAAQASNVSQGVETVEKAENDKVARDLQRAQKAQNVKIRQKEQGTQKTQSPQKAQATQKAPKKARFQFLRDVRSELRRVTWPSRQEVLRWSGVVAVALLFFGLFVAFLDNVIVTPILVLISGADFSTIPWLSFLTGGSS